MVVAMAWTVYLVAVILTLLDPEYVFDFVCKASTEGQYSKIIVLYVVGIVAMIIMMCEYGFFRMVGIQVILGVLGTIRGYFHTK